MGRGDSMLLLPHSTRGLLLLLLLILLVPVMLLQAFTYYQRFQDRRAQELRANVEIARAVTVAFDAYVRDVLDAELAMGIALTPPEPVSDAQINRVLVETARQYPSLREFFWMNARGVVVASSNPQLVGVDASDRLYFQQILQGSDWAVSDLLQARVGGEPVFTIARGIHDAGGALRGAVVATVLPDKLDLLALPIQRTGQGAIMLVDRQGMLVFRYPKVESSWEQRNLLDSEPFVRQVLAGEELAGSYSSVLDGRARLAGLTPIRSIGWAARASRPEDETMASVREDLWRDAALFVAVAFGAFFVALFASRRLTSPISHLRKHALALGEGQLDRRVAISGTTELEDLAAAFNKMAWQIQGQQEDLAKLAAIVESSDDAIIGKTLDGTITSWNAGATRLYGYSSEEMVGQSISILTPPERQDDLRAIIERLRRAERVEAYDTVRVHKDGSRVDASVTVSPIVDPSGKVIGASTIARDIAERKRAEAERERLLAEVELRATELDVANKELEAFSYSVSHDLRAPLRAIDGFSQALSEDYASVLDDRGKQYLQFVRSGSQKMAQLIDDMLTLSRVTRSELRREPVDLSTLARELAAELHRSAPQRAVEFVVAPGLIVKGDPRLLRIVLENLLHNAWKFTAQHSRARIEFGATHHDGELAYFVRDDGAGFDMAYANKLFGAFQRLHSEREFPGSGIGLATVQRIIRRHGGRVWAEGAVEHGATFYFTLMGLAGQNLQSGDVQIG